MKKRITRKNETLMVVGLALVILWSFMFSFSQITNLGTQNVAAVTEANLLNRIRAFFKVAPGVSNPTPPAINTSGPLGSDCNDPLACNYVATAAKGPMDDNVVCKYEKYFAFNLAGPGSSAKRDDVKPETVQGGYPSFTPPTANADGPNHLNPLTPNPDRTPPKAQVPQPLNSTTRTYDVGGVAWSVKGGRTITWTAFWLGAKQMTPTEADKYTNLTACGGAQAAKDADDAAAAKANVVPQS